MTKAPRKRNFPEDSFWCECGNRKTAMSIACERCTYLDGLPANKIIPALRDLGHANVYQLAEHIDGSVRNVQIALRRLENMRRVKKTVVDGYSVYKLIYYC